jgi:hypothetical protein
MPTLHIEHPITDFGAWNSAFARFAEARRQAGVRAQRIQRPAGDPNYVVIDLDFGTHGEAETFLRFLKTWCFALLGLQNTDVSNLFLNTEVARVRG